MNTLNSTPASARVHIAFFGRSNSGKSSLINAVTGQNTAIVSPVSGTTTDPVYKTMEILPIGPCVLIDTAGLDDTSELGSLRIKKSFEALNKTDIALYVIDGALGFTSFDNEMIEKIKEKKIPVIVVINKADVLDTPLEIEAIKVSSQTGEGLEKLKEAIKKAIKPESTSLKIVGDLINKDDIVVLVTPIDKSAPKGRLILPQQQTIRDILDSGAISIVTREHEYKTALKSLSKKPKLVVTDSQAFKKISIETPPNIPLTSFSILFARLKGDFREMIKGAKVIDTLNNGDKILIAEACTHHAEDDDIGRVKIPRMIKEKTCKSIEFEYVAGNTFPDDLDKYKLIIHCGGCMINSAQMKNRINFAKEQNVNITNYGLVIAQVLGILDRATAPFKEEI